VVIVGEVIVIVIVDIADIPTASPSFRGVQIRDPAIENIAENTGTPAPLGTFTYDINFCYV